MKRTILAAVLLSTLASTAAFADGGIGLAGSYQDQSWIGASTKTRAQVRAEIAAARRDGSSPRSEASPTIAASIRATSSSSRVSR